MSLDELIEQLELIKKDHPDAAIFGPIGERQFGN